MSSLALRFANVGAVKEHEGNGCGRSRNFGA
jgi:hypothetical protein